MKLMMPHEIASAFLDNPECFGFDGKRAVVVRSNAKGNNEAILVTLASEGRDLVGIPVGPRTKFSVRDRYQLVGEWMSANNGISTDLVLIHLFEEGDADVLAPDAGDQRAVSGFVPASPFDVQKSLELAQFADSHFNAYDVFDDQCIPFPDRSDLAKMREEAKSILRAGKWAHTELPGFVEAFCCLDEDCDRTTTLYRHQNGEIESATFEYRRVSNGDMYSPVFDTEDDARKWIIDTIAQTNVQVYSALKAVREFWMHNQDMTQHDVRNLFDGVMNIDRTYLELVDPRPDAEGEVSEDEWIEAIRRVREVCREWGCEVEKTTFLREEYGEFRAAGDPRLTFERRISTSDWIDFKRCADELFES